MPILSNSLSVYREVGVLPLSENRKLATTNYVVRSLSIQNSVCPDILLDSAKDYPKRSRNITYLQPIKNYLNDLVETCNTDLSSIALLPITPILPAWEHHTAHFDTCHGNFKKLEESNFPIEHSKREISRQIFSPS